MKETRLNDPLIHLTSACGAGISSALVTSPFWVVKTRFVLQDYKYPIYNNTFDAFRKIFREEGIRELYKGLVPSLFGVSHVCVQFPVYEHLKTWRSPVPSGSEIILASIASKAFATIITYPHEVLRTRMQNSRFETVKFGSLLNP